MARWKMAGHLAVAMREAEKQAEQRRITEEQYQESIKNGNILRKLARHRARITCHAKGTAVTDDRMMAVLDSEMENARRDAIVARSDYFKRNDKTRKQTLMDNLETRDASSKQFMRLKEQMSMLGFKDRDLEFQIRETRHKLLKFNREMENMHVVGADKVVRRQEVIEKNYGSQLTENRHLKDELSHYLMEKEKVTRIRKLLEKDCDLLSKELQEYSEEARTTYDSRDMNWLNMGKLRDHMDKSSTAFESDMQLMQFKINVLKRMERFMTTKNRFRADEGLERRREIRSQISITEKDSMNLASILDRVRKGLGQKDVLFIIRTFNELQEENYMLFKNISETRGAAHAMMNEIDMVKEKIALIRKAKQQNEQEAFTHKVELIDRTDKCRKEADVNEEYIGKADQVIGVYIQGILAILNKLGYSEEHIMQIAGIFENVEERNVLDFTAEIEHYINKIYDLRTLTDFLVYDKAQKSSHMPLPPEPLPPRLALVQRVVVVPPHHEEADDVDDAALPTEAAFRPLERPEISHHVDDDLEIRGKREELGVPVPSPTMTDATSEAIGDLPESPLKYKKSVDIF